MATLRLEETKTFEVEVNPTEYRRLFVNEWRDFMGGDLEIERAAETGEIEEAEIEFLKESAHELGAYDFLYSLREELKLDIKEDDDLYVEVRP